MGLRETLQSIRDRGATRFADRMLSYSSFRTELVEMEMARFNALATGHSKYMYLVPYFDMVRSATFNQELSKRYDKLEQEIKEIST